MLYSCIENTFIVQSFQIQYTTKCSVLCALQKLFMIIFNCIMLYLIFNKL